MAHRIAALVSALPLTYAGMAFAPATRQPAGAGVADIAHRGASAHAPENTLASFYEARAANADYFELDVQETRDHVPIIMHDATLSRTTDAEKVFPGRSPWRVGDFTLAQIKRLDAGSWFSARYAGERVPTLTETLRDMEGSDMKLLLELKNPALYPGMTGRVAQVLRAQPDWLLPDRTVVQSFDWPSVESFHRLLPSVPTGVIGTPTTRQLPAVARYAGYVNPRYDTVSAAYVRAVHTQHMKVFAWVADSPATMRRLIDDRVDGIVSNRPEAVPH
ncbi:glycerophosphodiester phosphodiesterase family protein [Actinoallomurus sp. NBC_01490]|uniref:glycerophosphodiester phosphodiesterase n=1 Tax=Actinoallomurus sp. NBC_01490 TaxID=2903557 RepID=UPI002E32E4BA|nr:glycerophosphodiester phosphodiesterase family protein [Actinoallomurus sp. NBC_01490]